jgi:hypothetical protein
MFHRFTLILILALGIVASNNLSADEPRDYSGYSVVRVTVDSRYEIDQVTHMVESVWTDYPSIGVLPVLVSPEQLRALEAAGYKYVVQIADVQPLMARQMESAAAGRSDWDHYMNLAEITAYINNLAAARPDLCEVFSIGQSIQGRDLWVLHITGTPGGNKPAVFYQSSIHAREWISGPCVLYLANHLVSNYDVVPTVKNLVDSLDIYLLPVVNPDGYSYTWTNDRNWRKNRRNNGDGSYGVDLNRNWAWGWGGPGASGYPSDETYYGTGPFSEPETAAISDFLIAHPNIVAHMDYHSFSQLLMWPFGNECVGGPPEPDGSEFETLGNQMSSQIQFVHGKYYQAGPICETIYQASGGSTDWVYADQGIFGFTIELRDTGEYGFVLPPEQILPTCQENLPAIMTLTNWAAQQVGTQITLASALPEIVPPGTPTALQIQTSSIGETIVSGSELLYYRFDGGTYLTAPLTALGGGLYAATLPAARCEDTPEFYFGVTGTASGAARLPATAPTAVYSLAVGELVQVFQDNFNTNLGWTVQNDAALTDGAWDRGIPVTNCSRGNPTADYDGSGYCYLTDNAAQADCNTDVDGGKTWLNSPTIDLSGGDATVQYALWYTNDFGSDPDNDLFKVYVSNNNGTSWTLVATFGPQTSSGWTVHAFDVAAFITPTATVKVRFEASDLGSGSVVEAGVDAFSVRRLQCENTNCPGDLDGDLDIDIADLAQLLAHYGATSGATYEQGDLDGDGDVDLSDLAALLAVYGTGC